MKTLFDELFETLDQLRDCPLFQRLKDAKVSLTKYLVDSRSEVERFFDMDLHEYTSDFSLIEEETHAQFDKKYRAMKESQLIRGIFKSLEAIIVYRGELMQSGANVSVKNRLAFIARMPGVEWCPFPFEFDIKSALAMDGVGQNTYSFMVGFLERYYRVSKRLWDKSQEPDIDVDKFAEVIGNSIEKLQQLPELHRCRNAFGKIKNSLSMFKDNFSSYYHNYIDTKDSTSIMHEFIMDVSKTSDTNPKLASEFRTIINYYRKLASQQKSVDPNTKKLFEQIDEAFKKTESDIDGDAIRKASREDVVAAHKSQPKGKKQAPAPVETPTSAAAVSHEDIDEVVRRIEGDGTSSRKPPRKK
jgi:hypothetical protein